MKYLLGITVGLVALVAGLFIVFKLVAAPKALVAAPTALKGAGQTAAPASLGTTLGGAAALVAAAGGAYKNIFGAEPATE